METDANNESLNFDHEKSAIAYDDETVIWEGSPSQWVNLGTYIWWTLFLVGSLTFLLIWNFELSHGYDALINQVVTWSLLALGAISVLSIIYAYLTVRCERTTITRNHIKEAKGITRIFRKELYCEVSDIKDLNGPPAGLLGLFGLATLIIETKDADQPVITIRAIKDRDELREKLMPFKRKLKHERKAFFGD